jgi:hypothetical protein
MRIKAALERRFASVIFCRESDFGGIHRRRAGMLNCAMKRRIFRFA